MVFASNPTTQGAEYTALLGLSSKTPHFTKTTEDLTKDNKLSLVSGFQIHDRKNHKDRKDFKCLQT